MLLDGNWDFVGGGHHPPIVKGDATCLSISAASILAKVSRDRIMRAEADHYPGYDFDTNKGYPCPRHKSALRGMGPSAIHRRSWVFMDHLPWSGVERFVAPAAPRPAGHAVRLRRASAPARRVLRPAGRGRLLAGRRAPARRLLLRRWLRVLGLAVLLRLAVLLGVLRLAVARAAGRPTAAAAGPASSSRTGAPAR